MPKKTKPVATSASLPDYQWTGFTDAQAVRQGSQIKGGPQPQQVPTNAPFGGSQGTATVKPTPGQAPTQPAMPALAPTQPAPPPTPAPSVPATPAPRPRPPAQPAERVEPAPGEGGRPWNLRGAVGDTGPILLLGGGLILVNAAFGNNSGSLLAKVWQTPEKQQMEAPNANIWPFVGEVLFLLVLVTIARVAPGMQRPIIALLIGIWLLWAIFRFPDLAKQGWTKNLGNLFAGTPLESALPAKTSSTTSARPVTQTRTSRLLALNAPASGSGGSDYTSHPVFSYSA